MDIEIIDEFEGSIEILVSFILGVYSNIASLKDFYDSLKLIRSQSEKLIKKDLSSKYGDVFKIHTSIEYPSTDRYAYFEEMFFHGKGRPFFLPVGSTNSANKRDGLFWYLLISNIVMLIILILMTYKAVINQYG